MSVIPKFPILIEGLLPPSQATWELAMKIMQYFPLGPSIQFFVPFFGMGKFSAKDSRFNLPGKFAWVTMELPALIVSGYVINALPASRYFPNGFNDLPGTNKLLIALFMLHYANRALLTPLMLTPSIAPIHVVVWLSAMTFNTLNAIQIAGWLGGYGPTTSWEWRGSRLRITIGMMIWMLGLWLNVVHEEELREIRRKAQWKQEQKELKGEVKKGEKTERVYELPQGLGFNHVLYPHYLCEWIEWAGFWLIGGAKFVPARNFLLAEMVPMLFQAYYGKKWYVEKFGKENVGDRKAVIPFLF